MTDPMVVLGTLLIGLVIGFVAGVALAVHKQQLDDEQLRRILDEEPEIRVWSLPYDWANE